MTLVPAELAQTIREREGAAGEQWLRALPERVETLCDRWRLRPAGPLGHGVVGVVLAVERDGVPLALKVSYPDPDSRAEATVLRAWRGDGGVRLYESDGYAMLLERLDPGRDLHTVGLDAAVAVIGALLRQLHRHPGPPGVTHTNDLCRRWAAELPEQWARNGQPCSRSLLAAAVGFCDGLRTDEEVLLHGDLHYANVLAGERQPWLAIDPKGVVGDPAYEALPPVWNRMGELDSTPPAEPDRASGLRRRHTALCAAAGLETARAARWSVVRAVQNAVSDWRTTPGDTPQSDVEVAESLLPFC